MSLLINIESLDAEEELFYGLKYIPRRNYRVDASLGGVV